MQEKKCKRGRPILDAKQKVDREILKQKFLEHSVEALECIISIMRSSQNDSIRLKASTYILNKVVPDRFIEESEIDRNINVTITTYKSPNAGNRPNEEELEMMSRVENDETFVYSQEDTLEPWETDDASWNEE